MDNKVKFTCLTELVDSEHPMSIADIRKEGAKIGACYLTICIDRSPFAYTPNNYYTPNEVVYGFEDTNLDHMEERLSHGGIVIYQEILEDKMTEKKSFFDYTDEEREKIMEENPPKCTMVHNGSAYFTWSWPGCGLGDLSFTFNEKTGKFDCMNEFMGPVSCRKFLHAYADYVADNLNLLEWHKEDTPPKDFRDY